MRGSVFAPRLGLHVHVRMDGDALVETSIRREPHPEPAPAPLRPLLARLADHCAGGRDAFRDVPVSLDAVAPFHREVLATLAREVPPGRVVTYGELARMVGASPGAARAVGGAMARNPLPIVVPCHRVLPTGGGLGSYSGEGGCETKRRLLEIEGVALGPRQARLPLA